jgi:hypothetical protein
MLDIKNHAKELFMRMFCGLAMFINLFMIVQDALGAAHQNNQKNLLTGACEEIITCPHVATKPVSHGLCLQKHLLDSFEQGNFSTPFTLLGIVLQILKRAAVDAGVPLIGVFQGFFLQHVQNYRIAHALHEIFSLSCDTETMACATTGCDDCRRIEAKTYYCDRADKAILFRITYDPQHCTLALEPHMSCPPAGVAWYRRIFTQYVSNYFTKHGGIYNLDTPPATYFLSSQNIIFC